MEIKKATNEAAHEEGAKVEKKLQLPQGYEFPKPKRLGSNEEAEQISKSALITPPNGLEELPIWGFPEKLQVVIEEVKEVLQCPRDYIVSSMIYSVATAVGKRVALKDKYTNYPCLWFAIVGKSGANKSQPMKWAIEPLRKINYKLEEENNEAVVRWKEDQQQQGERPQAKRVLMGDNTPEKRYDLLRKNPNGIGLFRDELRGFFKDIGRYTKSGETEHLLSIWDNDDIQIDRLTQESFIASKPFMNILGSIQPDILKFTFGNLDFMADGLNQRFLFVWPNEQPPQLYNEQVIKSSTTEYWKGYIYKLFNETEDYNTFQLSAEAKPIYSCYCNELRKRGADEESYIATLLKKLEIQVLRYALTISIINNFDEKIISAETMKFSVESMRYFEWTGRKVFELLRQPLKPLSHSECIKGLSDKIINQSQFANSIGVSQAYISKILNNR